MNPCADSHPFWSLTTMWILADWYLGFVELSCKAQSVSGLCYRLGRWQLQCWANTRDNAEMSTDRGDLQRHLNSFCTVLHVYNCLLINLNAQTNTRLCLQRFFLGEIFLSRSARLCFLSFTCLLVHRDGWNPGIMKNCFLCRIIILFDILIFRLFTKKKRWMIYLYVSSLKTKYNYFLLSEHNT